MEVTHSQLSFLKSHNLSCVGIIGKGSYSKAILCQGGIQTKFKICCKIVTFEKNKDKCLYKFFPREMEILSVIKHPNIIQTYGIYKRNETFYILMRFAEKRDLSFYIIKNNCVPEYRVKFWTSQIAAALSYIHSMNIVHRDIKCENIFLTINENIRIGDFGFARRLSDENQLCSTWCGSLSYMAPEILMKRSHDARKLDSWSFGVVIYTLLAAKVPFQDATPRGLLQQQRKTLMFDGSPWKDVSYLAKASIRKLLKVNPGARWLPSDVLTCSWLTKESRQVTILNKSKLNSTTSEYFDQSVNRMETDIKVPNHLSLEKKVLLREDKSLNYFDLFKSGNNESYSVSSQDDYNEVPTLDDDYNN